MMASDPELDEFRRQMRAYRQWLAYQWRIQQGIEALDMARKAEHVPADEMTREEFDRAMTPEKTSN